MRPKTINALLAAVRGIADLSGRIAVCDQSHLRAHSPELREEAEALYRRVAELCGRTSDVGSLFDPYDLAEDDEADDGRVFGSVAEIARANTDAGGFWFTPGAMQAFDSKTYGSVHHGRYFISSERRDKEPRRYKVRYADHRGRVHEVGVPGSGSAPGVTGAEWRAEESIDFPSYTVAARWLDKQVEAGKLPAFGPAVVDARKVRGE